MTYQPITPFRRPVDVDVIEHHRKQMDAAGLGRVQKWDALRELAVGRDAFGLTDRALGVLRALLSFHPVDDLDASGGRSLIVFPSNSSLCERLNGMPCSTMRRHLGHLVRSGMILRRDSPNGKRYKRRYDGAGEAFGFDLVPLVYRFAEISAAAEAARAAREQWKRARQTVSVMRRDLSGLAAIGAAQRPELTIWDQFDDLARLTARSLRRQVSLLELKEMEAVLSAALDEVRQHLDLEITVQMSTNDADNEQHYHNSNKDTVESEPCLEKATGGDRMTPDHIPRIPIGLVTSCCEEIHSYAPRPIEHWHDLVAAADIVRPMMGISLSAWEEARDAMGYEEAAIVVAAMLERFDQIKSPGGYLRSLARKAQDGAFSSGPMVMALMRRAG